MNPHWKVWIPLWAALSHGFAAEPPADEWTRARQQMVKTQLEARGVRNAAVLAAMRKVPRHELVPASEREWAYGDSPLPISEGQTISQPYIVAYMTEQLDIRRGERVLEIGTGSGYQAAVLAELGAEVFTIEIVAPLAERAKADLARLGYRSVHVRAGDGYRGWPEQAPFDAVIVTAAPETIPQPLVDQLRVGGRMIVPVGDAYQELVMIRKTKHGIKKERLIPVRFVPMTGEVEKHD